VMNDEIMNSRLLDLILEKKANDHVGSHGVDCHWMPCAHASRGTNLLAMQTMRA
jgi:hypothetical protein